MHTYVLIPAYDPDERLIPFVKKLKQADMRVILVNDGSKEECNTIFHACRNDAFILNHLHNRGKGAALRTGLAMIQRENDTQAVIVTADCDGQHTICDIERCAKEAAAHPGTLILGSRNFNRTFVPLRSRFGNKITSGVFRLVTSRCINDTQTGLRAFTSDLCGSFLNVKGSRYEYETNVLLYTCEENIPIREIPIQTIYFDQNKGSHFNTLRDSLIISWQLIKFGFTGFSSFLIDYGFFLIFARLLSHVAAANLLAGFISASWNYVINTRTMFRYDGSPVKSAGQYALMTGMILVLSTMILLFFTHILQFPEAVAKVLAECILFFFTCLKQHNVIFVKEANSI